MIKSVFKTGILLVLVSFSTMVSADSGALYEAWDEGEEVVTNQSSSLITGGFFYSPDEEMTEPPPPEKPKWGRFKSIEEHGAIPVKSSTAHHVPEPDYYENHDPDPFSHRINDIESLLSGE